VEHYHASRFHSSIESVNQDLRITLFMACSSPGSSFCGG